MKNNLTTTQKTEVVLAKGKSLLGITAKILSGSKALATVNTHKDITIIGDLMWENVPNPEEHKMHWHAAMTYAKNLRLGGYYWRLPTIEELEAVVRECGGNCSDDGRMDIRDRNRKNESYQSHYNEKRFNGNKYWSSTTDPTSINSYAKFLHFEAGFTCHLAKHNTLNVRCIGGKKPFKDTTIYSYNIELYQALSALRDELALKNELPYFIVFSDRTLSDMIDKNPQNKEEMLQVLGIGERKFERYGDTLLRVLQSFQMDTK